MSTSQDRHGPADVHAAAHVVARWAHALDSRDWAADPGVGSRARPHGLLGAERLGGGGANPHGTARRLAGCVGRVASSQHLVGLPDVTVQGAEVRVTANA